ncbi:2-C-methyl-D-erythritol 2,4-cyclodiphosphate synthase [Glaciecola punicea ACAM 611]|jgi:2-C-methyl-D-erythritol 2,4-cyclodiphosphate synthase|uniref:2-C-methyl-D-erythritol 2,4-cyclodiphosphate synthase n=1 Tax=Glaciecola punicea ACAM 611 TaxID=1121923 RepID=H5TEK7_9ALTE|nr:2-C-methyl-D-erythritol 2,4-cyclodiphosphate synthase [Glaciecola punicea]OFA32294.1 2-C-methyl-D-erythritol 2,4-cyclodiphosphate synthase [Glaciecola punicea]GAB56734.1 2-C-methyl-D-erythritol 2,4-cyclodiphosphate synthase [Glaciecola punicea ACAM 611]
MIRVGHGYDVHKFGGEGPITLCGEKIDHTHGLIAHSDGDVAIHALCDALLGALALGDIGKHFPDTSADFKDADSMHLLTHVYGLINDKGYTLGNADITIAAQVPKLAPYILNMRSNIAKQLKISVDNISVKATTTEKLGFVGREEGIEAHAMVLVCAC